MNGWDCSSDDKYYREYCFIFKDYILEVYRISFRPTNSAHMEYEPPHNYINIKRKGDEEFEQIVSMSTTF